MLNQYNIPFRTHKSVTTIPTKGENINIAWSPDGSTIAVGNKEDLVTFIDTKTYKSVSIFFVTYQYSNNFKFGFISGISF